MNERKKGYSCDDGCVHSYDGCHWCDKNVVMIALVVAIMIENDDWS